MAVRAPHLYRSLRLFSRRVLAPPRSWSRAGSCRSPSRSTPRRPARALRVPAARPRLRRRARRDRCAAPDSRAALDDLRAEPAAQIFARAHAGGSAPARRGAAAAPCSLPLVTSVAEACAGFDWNDEAFDRAYVELERSLFGDAPRLRRRSRRSSGSRPARRRARRRPPAPRRRAGRARRALARGERAAAGRLRPRARPALRARARAHAARRRRRAARTRRASSPTRSAPCASRPPGAISAGPVLFERLDWRPFGIRPVLPDRRDAAARRGDAARPGARGRSPPTCARGSRRSEDDPELGRGARPLGAVAVPGRAVPLGAAARVAGRAARRHRRAVGGGRARGGAARRDAAGSRRAARAAAGARRRARRSSRPADDIRARARPGARPRRPRGAGRHARRVDPRPPSGPAAVRTRPATRRRERHTALNGTNRRRPAPR